MNEKQKKALQVLYECAIACDHCFSSCLQEEDVKMMTNCIRLNVECAQICRTTAALIAQEVSYIQEMAEVCSDVCAACARECEEHEHEHCKVCAEVCRRCEEVCDEYGGGAL